MTKAPSRVLLNVVSTSGVRIVAMLISFIVTPVLFHALGATQFGLYAIVGSLTAYFGILDLGIGAGLVRHLTFHSERGESHAVRQVLTFGVMFYLMLGLALTPLVVWSAPFFASAMNLHGPEAHTGAVLMVAMYGYFILSSLAGVAGARLVSLHRMDIEAVIGLFAQIVSTTVLLIFVWRFPNLYFVIALGFGQVFLSGLCNLIAIWRLSPGFLCNPWRIKPAFVGALFSFGGWSQICSLSSVINLEADKFVLGHFLGVASVTPYQVGNKVALLNRILPLQILGALLPDTTAAVSRGAALAQMQTIYARNSRYLMIATLLITGFIVAVADVFIRVWIGAPVPMAAAVTTALVISYSVNNLTGIGTVFMKAEGKPKYEAYYAMLGAAANIIFTIILTPQFGLYGVIGGTILGNCIGSVFFIVLFHRINGFPWWPTVGRWLLPLLIGVCAAIVATRALLWAIPGGWVQTRALGLLLLGVGGSAYVAVLIGVLAVFRFWTPEDLALVRRLGGRFVGRRGETITLSASEGNLS